MAVMVKNLYRNGMSAYGMHIVAGRDGLNNPVKWVHIIEDDSLIGSLRGNELVFSTGILNERPGWLLDFVRKLREAGVSALTVSVGAHIAQIPAEVLRYCDETALPLFTVPSEAGIVDMARDFCRRIMRGERAQSDVASAFKNIVFGVGDMDAQILRMERAGIQAGADFCFVCVRARGKGDGDAQGDSLRIAAQKCVRSGAAPLLCFRHQGALVFVLVNYTQEQIERFAADISEFAARALPGASPYVGVSGNQTGLPGQAGNLEKALAAADIAEKRGRALEFYDRLDFYKLLYAVGDRSLLRGFYGDTVGKIRQYDRENKTMLAELLRAYLESDASLQAVADRMCVHRNTVTNQLKKIESVTGHNPLSLPGRLMLSVGFRIEDIL